jgi:hypothetical protein
MAETDLDRLDKLISWYEKNKPEAGKRIPVALTPAKIAKMFNKELQPKQMEFNYRGRVIYSTVTSDD